MKVQEIILIEGRKRYLLTQATGEPVAWVAAYMKMLDITGKSPNTQKTYCYALKRYFEYLEEKELSLDKVDLKHIAEFMVWLRFPEADNHIIILSTSIKPLCCEKTVNLIVSVVVNFYEYLYRNQQLDRSLHDITMGRVFVGRSRRYKDFLYHVSKGKLVFRSVLKLKEPVKRLKIMDKGQVEAIYAAATNIRDKFLIRLLFETGMRIGEALSLFVEDFVYDLNAGHRIRLTYRGELMNGARLKSGERIIHISQDLMNLFDDYLYEILDSLELDSNFVFVKLRGENKGTPMNYSDVSAVFRTLKNKTGINIHPHLLRHTHATIFYNQTKDIKQVQERLGHSQIQTTLGMYLHPSEEEIREVWETAQPAFQMKAGE